MSFKVLAKATHAALAEYDEIFFCWHGGETTMVPLSFYQKAVEIQTRFRKPAQIIKNVIQTNGTTLNDEWARFFRDKQFSVGVSIDGPAELHNSIRRYPGDRPSFADAMRGFELLKHYQLSPSVLAVIGEGTLEMGADRFFDFFVEQGIQEYCCLRADPRSPTPGKPQEIYTSLQRMTAFLARLYDRWLDHGELGIHIRELDAIRQRLRGEDAEMCMLQGQCFGHIFRIEPEGTIGHCDCFAQIPGYQLGHIMTDTFSDLLRSPRLRQLREEDAQCRRALEERCPEFAVCKGGCAFERYVLAQRAPASAPDCCGYRTLIQHIRQRLPLEAKMRPQGPQGTTPP
jgi:uncharacterized protein